MSTSHQQFPVFRVPFEVTKLIVEQIRSIRDSIHARQATTLIRTLMATRGLLPRSVHRIDFVFDEDLAEWDKELHLDTLLIGIHIEEKMKKRHGEFLKFELSNRLTLQWTDPNSGHMHAASWPLEHSRFVHIFSPLRHVARLSLHRIDQLSAVAVDAYFGWPLDVVRPQTALVTREGRPIQLIEFYRQWRRVDVVSVHGLTWDELFVDYTRFGAHRQWLKTRFFGDDDLACADKNHHNNNNDQQELYDQLANYRFYYSERPWTNEEGKLRIICPGLRNYLWLIPHLLDDAWPLECVGVMCRYRNQTESLENTWTNHLINNHHMRVIRLDDDHLPQPLPTFDYLIPSGVTYMRKIIFESTHPGGGEQETRNAPAKRLVMFAAFAFPLCELKLSSPPTLSYDRLGHIACLHRFR